MAICDYESAAASHLFRPVLLLLSITPPPPPLTLIYLFCFFRHATDRNHHPLPRLPFVLRLICNTHRDRSSDPFVDILAFCVGFHGGIVGFEPPSGAIILIIVSFLTKQNNVICSNPNRPSISLPLLLLSLTVASRCSPWEGGETVKNFWIALLD